MPDVMLQTDLTIPPSTRRVSQPVPTLPLQQLAPLRMKVEAATETGDALTLFALLQPFQNQDDYVMFEAGTLNGNRVYSRHRAGDVLSNLMFHGTKTSTVKGVSVQTAAVMSPVRTAVEFGYNHVVRMLLTHFRVDGMIECPCMVGEAAQKAIRLLCEPPARGPVKEFVENGNMIFDVNPLWLAIYKKHFSVARTLMDHRANIHHRVSNGSTPLRVACYHDDWELVCALLRQGADPNVANLQGNTCLMLAAHLNNPKTVSELLRYGADVHARARCGSTALHFAVESPIVKGRVFDKNVFQMLVDRGARNTPNYAGVTPIMVAGKSGTIQDIACLFGDGDEFVSAAELADAWDIAFTQCTVGPAGTSFLIPAALRKAFSLRERTGHPRVVRPAEPAYGGGTEMVSLEEFEELCSLSSRKREHHLRLQNLLTQERVLGVHSPEAALGRVYLARGLLDPPRRYYQKALRILAHGLALAVQNRQKVALSIITVIDTTYKSYHAHNECYDSDTFIDDIMGVIDLVFTHINTLNTPGPLYGTLNTRTAVVQMSQTILRLLILVHSKDMSEAERRKLKQLIHRLCSIDHLEVKSKWNLLMIAQISAGQRSSGVNVDECAGLMDDLIECTRDLDQQSSCGNTALHYLVYGMRAPGVTEDVLEVQHRHVLRVLARGAHVDVRGREGRTPLELNPPYAPTVEALQPARYICLQCLAAVAVHRARVPHRGLVHAELEAFIDAHNIHGHSA